MPKASDSVNHYALFIKLMDRNVPVALNEYINPLVWNLYSICAIGYAFSDVICLQCGVRQGGVLSPVLFTVYVNDVIMALSVSVDDLLLLSPPLCDLQLMIDICCGELEKK